MMSPVWGYPGSRRRGPAKGTALSDRPPVTAPALHFSTDVYNFYLEAGLGVGTWRVGLGGRWVDRKHGLLLAE